MPAITDYLYRKASKNKIPLNGTFELSPVCNFACKMCYVRRTMGQIRSKGKRLYEWREWLELAEQCRDAGMLYLLLTGGEPFLYPDFQKLYEHLHQMGFVLSINTNGTMIDENTMKWLKRAAPARVNLTLYGASPETYERICGQASGYDRATGAIRMLAEAGIPTIINSSMIPENAQDMEKIIAFGKDMGIYTRIATYMFPPVRREREGTDSRFTPGQAAEITMRKFKCQLGEEEYRKRMETDLRRMEERKSSGQNGDWGMDAEYMRCRAGRSSFWISWDGTMTACGMMPFPRKEYPFEQEFKSCWLRLTDAVRHETVLQACAHCEKKIICNPCAAMLYAETKDVNEKSSYMCEMTECIIEKMSSESVDLKKMDSERIDSERVSSERTDSERVSSERIDSESVNFDRREGRDNGQEEK